MERHQPDRRLATVFHPLRRHRQNRTTTARRQKLNALIFKLLLLAAALAKWSV